MPPKRMDSPPPEDAGEEDEEVEVYRNPKGGGLFSSAMAMVQPGGGSSGPRSDAPPEEEPKDARARLALHQSMAERQHVVQVHRLLQRVVSSAPPPWLAKALMKLSPALAALGKIVNTAGPPLILGPARGPRWIPPRRMHRERRPWRRNAWGVEGKRNGVAYTHGQNSLLST